MVRSAPCLEVPSVPISGRLDEQQQSALAPLLADDPAMRREPPTDRRLLARAQARAQEPHAAGAREHARDRALGGVTIPPRHLAVVAPDEEAARQVLAGREEHRRPRLIVAPDEDAVGVEEDVVARLALALHLLHERPEILGLNLTVWRPLVIPRDLDAEEQRHGEREGAEPTPRPELHAEPAHRRAP